MKVTSVFILWHVHRDAELEGGENAKLIGVYSTREFAEQAQMRSGKLPGFKDHLNDFQIVEYTLNQDEWREGFATINAGEG